jgi:murein L,D-transpeptidase YcbB/YkuD
VAQVRILLHQPAVPAYFDNTLEDAVRRFQSENGLKVSGIVDKKTAILLADRAI